MEDRLISPKENHRSKRHQTLSLLPYYYTMHAISAMNNEAVRVYLRRGRYTDSNSFLLKALQGLYDMRGKEHAWAASPAAAATTVDFSVVRILEEEDSTALMAASASNLFAVYPNAFAAHCHGAINELTFVEVSAALIFNAGLTYHLRGLRQPTSRQNDLKEAIRHYGSALTLLRMNRSICADSVQSYLLTLALLNNLGHVFCDSGRMEESLRCAESMERLLEDDHFLGIPDVEAEFFSSGVLLTKSYSIRAAGAA